MDGREISGDNEYQRRCKAPREQFARRKVVRALFEEAIDARLLKLFMIHWNALSAGFTEPIPTFLKRAGERCAEKGLPEMSEFFAHHAGEEDGHESWATEDAKRLVERWNTEVPSFPLDAEALLAERMSPAVRRYHELHERVIEGDSPWAELAIDIEIELITTEYGPRLLRSCIEVMGEDALASVSFLREHVRFDVGHTETNFAVVDRLLTNHPQYADALVATAGDALQSYGDLLEDAMNGALAAFARMNGAARAS